MVSTVIAKYELVSDGSFVLPATSVKTANTFVISLTLATDEKSTLPIVQAPLVEVAVLPDNDVSTAVAVPFW